MFTNKLRPTHANTHHYRKTNKNLNFIEFSSFVIDFCSTSLYLETGFGDIQFCLRFCVFVAGYMLSFVEQGKTYF